MKIVNQNYQYLRVTVLYRKYHGDSWGPKNGRLETTLKIYSELGLNGYRSVKSKYS
jgi:hypothetical protein